MPSSKIPQNEPESTQPQVPPKPSVPAPGNLPPFDPDYLPKNPQNVAAALARGLKYSRGVYLDSDGCPVCDRFGQPF